VFILSLFAAFGGVVAIYQWGWLGGIFGVNATGPILDFLPTVLVGILFGLAMDYTLFLASGMREAYVHGAPAHGHDAVDARPRDPGAVARDEVARPDDVVSEHCNRDDAPDGLAGVVQCVGGDRRRRPPHRADIARPDGRAERQIACGEDDGHVGTETVRAPVQRSEIAGDHTHGRQHHHDRGGPSQKYTRRTAHPVPLPRRVRIAITMR